MSKLKMRIVKFEKAIACQILEMDERFAKSGSQHGHYFECANGFEIVSLSSPELFEGAIHTRGKASAFDYKTMVRQFMSNEARDEYVNLMTEALKDWAQNWEGFKEDQKSESHEDDFILEV